MFRCRRATAPVVWFGALVDVGHREPNLAGAFRGEPEHLSSDHRRCVLVLTGDEVSVNHPVIGEGISTSGLTLELSPELAQFSFLGGAALR